MVIKIDVWMFLIYFAIGCVFTGYITLNYRLAKIRVEEVLMVFMLAPLWPLMMTIWGIISLSEWRIRKRFEDQHL